MTSYRFGFSPVSHSQIFVKHLQGGLGMGGLAASKNAFSHGSYILMGTLSVHKYILNGYE